MSPSGCHTSYKQTRTIVAAPTRGVAYIKRQWYDFVRGSTPTRAATCSATTWLRPDRAGRASFRFTVGLSDTKHDLEGVGPMQSFGKLAAEAGTAVRRG